MTRVVLGASPSIAVAIGAALLAAVAFEIGSVALAQDQSAATPKDAIFARKILMDTVSQNMDDIETMVATGKIDLTEGRKNADSISVLMMVFPHLFPASSNQWKADAQRDAGTDTYAAPEVWTRFKDFYSQASSSSKSAYNASASQNAEEFKTFVAELRQGCNACHAAYLKTE